MPEGYQPSPAELGLAQEHLEAMSITERETDHGSEHVDVEGRVVMRTETWGEAQQATQVEYVETGGSIEHGKLLTGPESGKEVQREHPGSNHELALHLHDADLGEIPLTVAARLTTLGSTAGSGDEVIEPWAHFEISDPAALEPLRRLPAARRQQNDQGEQYAIIDGPLGGGQTIDVNGRPVVIESINRLSVVFSADGQPLRATVHKIRWTNSTAAE